MKPKLQKITGSGPLTITVLAVAGTMALFGRLARPNPGPGSAQQGACAEGGTGFQTTSTTGGRMAFTGTITVNQRNLSGAALITGLTNDQSYQVQVRVTCADTFGPWSTSASATPATATAADGPLGRVGSLKAAQTWWAPGTVNPAGWEYSVYADGSGRWFVEHQVDGSAPIPSTSAVEAKYSDLVRLGEYEAPASIIMVDPGEGQPGDEITLSAGKMPVHSRVSRIEIGGRDVMPAGTPGTDRDGAVTVEDIVIPGFDPGDYSVLLEVNNTVAIGNVDILPEGIIGSGAPASEALDELGDDLLDVFYFDGVSKERLFYDPRPEFAGLNTLDELVAGEAYWVPVTEDVEDVALGGKSRSLTCSAGGNCRNLMVW